MMNPPAVTVSHDPTPLELIFAKKFRDALEHKDYALTAAKFRGTFAIQSAKDPQAVTINCSDHAIALAGGIQGKPALIITINLSNPAAKPKIKGLIQHPMLALNVGKLLEFPEVSWADALKRFWEQHHEVAGMPSGLTVRCLDEDRQLSVGHSDSAAYFQGKARDLSEAFAGGSPFVELLVTGRLTGRFTFQQATVMSDVTLAMMLGEV